MEIYSESVRIPHWHLCWAGDFGDVGSIPNSPLTPNDLSILLVVPDGVCPASLSMAPDTCAVYAESKGSDKMFGTIKDLDEPSMLMNHQIYKMLMNHDEPSNLHPSHVWLSIWS